MPLTLELPPQVEEELRQEAQKEGISITEHTTLLLCIALALRETQGQTQLQQAVQATFSQHSLDIADVSSALNDVLQQCLPNVKVLESSTGQTMFVPWNTAQPEQSEQAQVATTPDMAGSNEVPQPVRQPSAMGKYARVPGSSDAFAEAKRQEIDREDRPRL